MIVRNGKVILGGGGEISKELRMMGHGEHAQSGLKTKLVEHERGKERETESVKREKRD